MKEFDARVWVFDPVVPFKKFAAHDPGIDTWHESVLITKELRAKIPHLTHTGYRRLQLSGGMSMSVPSVEVGLQIGKIQLPKISALVVDQGVHEVLLGRAIFQQIFSEREDRHTGEEASTEPEEPFRYSSKTKDDPSALSVEIYPVETPFAMHRFEKTIRSQRVIYNVALVASGEVQVDGLSASEVQEVIEDDSGVPDNLALQVSCIESGSIWMSMKSGSQSALKYLGSLFETGASARLAEQLANAQTAEANAQISEATRNDVAAQIRAEQEKLRVENIQQTYEVWSSELRSQLSFLDELIEHASDEAVVSKVKDLKNQAILQMADQQMVPIVRNVPGSFVSNDLDVLALPPPAT